MLHLNTHTTQLFCPSAPEKKYLCASQQVESEFWSAETSRLSAGISSLHNSVYFSGDSHPQSSAHLTIYHLL